MNRSIVRSSLVTAAVLLLGTTVAVSAPSGRPFITTLSGDAEVPAGDPDGSGLAFIVLNPGLGEVCWAIAVSGIALPATAAHIHIGPAGVAGPVVVPLSPPTTGFSSGCDEVDRDLIAAILGLPEEYYVNVHNAEFPAGAVRGQLSRSP